MKRGRIYLYLVSIFVVSLVVSYFLRGKSSLGFTETVMFAFLVVSSFVFGVIIAFSIANRHTRLSGIRDALRRQDALLLNIYLLSKIFGKGVSDKVRDKIDGLLISQIDYKLEDFDKESPDRFKEMFLYLANLGEKDNVQDNAKEKLLDNLEEILKIHKEVGHLIRNEMQLYEWVSSIILCGVIVFCLFYVNDNSLVSVVITSFLTTSLVLLLFVLRDLDSLEWQEQNWIWIPLSRLFIELDLVPYFPDAVFDLGRVRMGDLGLNKMRVAHYPKPYPDMTGKKVELINVK